MSNPLAAHPPWRRIVLVAIALPVLAALAVLVFAWPAGRIAPRDVPVGIVGNTPAGQAAVTGMTHAQPGAFELHLYPDVSAARRAIENRDVYGAVDVEATGVTVYTAGANGPTVTQILTATAARVAASAGTPLHTVDVVPASTSDPRGTVFSSSLLPLSICGTVVASVIALALGLRSAWRQTVALVVVAAGVGLGAWLVAQGFLGGLPNDAVATWASLSLLILAISSTATGLVALVGPLGLGVAAPVMVFVGNAFSGVTSAPELLPKAAGHLGQWLPPGAGASLLRSTAYFGGGGAGPHIAVLVTWSVLGLGAVFVGHHGFAGFAARAGAESPASPAVDEAPDESELPARHAVDLVDAVSAG